MISTKHRKLFPTLSKLLHSKQINTFSKQLKQETKSLSHREKAFIFAYALSISILVLSFGVFLILPKGAKAAFFQTITSGNWSDPSIWSGNVVPQAGDTVKIKTGHTITYDVLSDNVLGQISIEGTLKFSRATNTRLKTSENIIVENGGFLDMGISSDYIPKNIKSEVIFTLTQAQADAFVPVVNFEGASKGLWAMDGSRWEVYGAPLTRTWSKLSQDALAGASTVTVVDDTTDWYAGGTIVITQTNGVTYTISGTEEKTSFIDQDELRTIQSLEKLPDGKTKITLDKPLSFKHDGISPMQGEVALLTRNILFKTEIVGADEGTYLTDVRTRKFAHTAYMMGGTNPAKGNIQYAEFKYMGHYGIKGTYAIHAHQALENSRGMVIRGTSGWYNGFRCVNLHVTHGVLVEDNVCYNSQSTSYYQEQDDTLGFNQDNAFVHNIGIGMLRKHRDDRNNQAIPGQAGRGATEFWPGAKTANEAFLGNVAVGVGETTNESTPKGLGVQGQGTQGFHFPEDGNSPDNKGTMPFTFVNNEVHSKGGSGINTWQNAVPSRDIVGSLLWRNGHAGIFWGAYGMPNKYFNSQILENGKYGIDLVSVNTFLQDSTITGATADGSSIDVGYNIRGYFAAQYPTQNVWVVRNTFKNLNTTGITQIHDQCTDTLKEKRPAIPGDCSAVYITQMGNKFENVNNILDFGWQANANAFWRVFDWTGGGGLPTNFVLLRKDQNDTANQGPISEKLVNSQTSYSSVVDSLVTPMTSLSNTIEYTNLQHARDGFPSWNYTFTTVPDYPPQISLTTTLNGKVATLKATATDDKGVTRVEFFKDWELIDTKTSAPYETTIDLSTHPRKYAYLYARAFDGIKQLGGISDQGLLQNEYEQRAYSNVTEVGPEVLAPAIISTPTSTPTGVPVATPTPASSPTPTPIPTPIVSIPTPTPKIGGTPSSKIPLIDMGGLQTYFGFSGGLYPNASNTMPSDHSNAGIARLPLIQPRNTSGAVDTKNGKIVLLSIGMSNTSREWADLGTATTPPNPPTAESFMGQAAASASVNHTTLTIFNGAQGGQCVDFWQTTTDSNFGRVAGDLINAGLNEKQVQAVWLKQAHCTNGPGLVRGTTDADPYTLKRDLANTIRAAKIRYPNLQMIFLSSRIYGGYAGARGEPWSYESGFAVKWLIEAQINQIKNGTIDPTAGDLNYNTVAPWIAWGPYIWADDGIPNSEGLSWLQSDFISDFIHPSHPAGAQKVGKKLLDFFLASPHTAPWFTASGVPIPTSTPTPTSIVSTPTPTTTPTPKPTSTPIPTPTPTPTNVPGVPTSTPTPSLTPTPIPLACAINSALWVTSSNPVIQGTTVTLSVTTNNVPSCVGKQVAFDVRQDNGLLPSGSVDVNPAPSSIINSNATAAWVAEYHPNGPFGLEIGSPHYYFNVNIVGDTQTVRSLDPTLQVDKAQTLVISTTPQVTTGLNSATVTWDTNKNASSKVEYGVTKKHNKSTSESDIATRVTSHSITIPKLKECRVYHYAVVSKDDSLNQATSDDSKFITLGCDASVVETVETDIAIDDKQGGDLNLVDSTSEGVDLSIPKDFSTEDAFFQILKLNETEFINNILSPTGLTNAGDHVYALNAILGDEDTEISTFDKNITIKINYSDQDILGIDENSLTIYRWDGKAWSQLLGCTLDTTNNNISCPTTNFSDFVLFGKSIVPTPTPTSTQTPTSTPTPTTSATYSTPSYGTPSYGTPSSDGGYGTPSYSTPGIGGIFGGVSADLNHDGKINIFDLSILLRKWSTIDSSTDLNHDGRVNIFDLSILLRNWGK